MASITRNPAVAPHLLSPVANQIAFDEKPQTQVFKPRDVVTTFNYYKDPADGGPPHPTIVGKPETYDRERLSVQQVVHDIRESEDQYTLDTTGFQIYKHESAEKEFLDDDKIKAIYYPEVEQLLKDATGAAKVFIFDHTIRRQKTDARGKPLPENNETISQPAVSTGEPITVPVPNILRGPVQQVHIDQSYAAAPSRVTYHLPDEADKLLAGRFQIINVWRPIKTIRKDPLGVIAAKSVHESELVGIKLIYPHREGETFGVRPAGAERTDKGHQWHYLSEQRPDEVTLIKCFDSKTDGRARGVPHSSFVDEKWTDEEPRESIEVRCLVFHPDDTD